MAAEAAAAMRPDTTQQTLRSLQTQVDGLMTEVDLLKRQIRQLQSN
jgi:prefoldin subunit 5